MKTRLLIVALLMLLGILNATLLLEDNFTGTVGTLLTANGWTAHSGTGTTPMSIASPGLEYSGYLSSGIGNATSSSGNGEDVNKAFTSTNSGSLYCSFLVNTAITTTTAGYISHFYQNASTFYARFWIRLVGSDVNFGIAKTTAAATWDPTNYAKNTTYLIVLKYTFNTGSSSDDAVYMFVNPILNSTEPTPNVSVTTDTAGDATSLSAAAIRQYNTGQLTRFDGFRVGTEWADIAGTPVGNNPPSITNITKTPASGVTSLDTVSISATVTDSDGTISGVELKWGTSTGSYPNTINMSAAKGVYTTDSPIPAQSIGTTVYFTIEATDDADDTTISIESNYFVNSPPPPASPIANGASNVNYTGFTANWDAVDGANSYELDVYTRDGVASGLFFSEYIEGASNNKAIEIYNGTGDPVDLSAYTVKLGPNGGVWGSGITLTSILDNGDVFVIGHADANAEILAQSDALSTVTYFNGDDTVGLFQGETLIDVIGSYLTDPGTAWNVAGVTEATLNHTLIRKSSVDIGNTNWAGSAGTDSENSEWTVQAQDYVADLGQHTFSGGRAYIFQDDNVGNVTSYVVTGLNPNTSYYYVVRAVGTYGTSSSSNTIAATTSDYDYPAGIPVVVGDETITVSGGNANNGSGTPPAWTNPSFTPSATYSLTLIGAGPWTVTIATTALWGAFYQNGQWYTAENVGGSIVFNISPTKDEIVEIILGDQDPTLPVELSSFTATMTAQNLVSVMWVTQTETNVNGYYVYRGSSSELNAAAAVSSLIGAYNTSQQQVYQFTDTEVFEPGTYYYWLQVQDLDGSIQFHGPTTVYFDNEGNNGTPVIPKVTELKSIYPNPFNPSTTIYYSLAKAETVDFVIYNNRGQIVRSFNEGNKGIGNHSLRWNGEDQYGRSCSTGIYYIKMTAGKDSFIRKAVLMK